MGTVPTAVTVRDLEAVAPTVTSPKLIELALNCNEELCKGLKAMLNALETPPNVAVIVPICGVDTLFITAVNEALVAPRLTTTVPGTAIPALFDCSETYVFRDALHARYTVQAFVPLPMKVLWAQDSELRGGAAEATSEVAATIPIARVFARWRSGKGDPQFKKAISLSI